MPLDVTVFIDTVNGANAWTGLQLGVFKSLDALFKETSWNGTGMCASAANQTWYVSAPDFDSLGGGGVKLRCKGLTSNDSRTVFSDTSSPGNSQSFASQAVWGWPNWLSTSAATEPEFLGPVAWIDWAALETTWYNRPMRGLWRRSSVSGINGATSTPWRISLRGQRQLIQGWRFFSTGFTYNPRLWSTSFTNAVCNQQTSGLTTIKNCLVNNGSVIQGAFYFPTAAANTYTNGMQTVLENVVQYNISRGGGTVGEVIGDSTNKGDLQPTNCMWLWNGTPTYYTAVWCRPINCAFLATTSSNSGGQKMLFGGNTGSANFGAGTTKNVTSDDSSFDGAAYRNATIGGATPVFVNDNNYDPTMADDTVGKCELIPNTGGALWNAGVSPDTTGVIYDLLGLPRAGAGTAGNATIGAIDNNSIPADASLASVLTTFASGRTAHKVGFLGRSVAGFQGSSNLGNPVDIGIASTFTVPGNTWGDAKMWTAFGQGEFSMLLAPDGIPFVFGGGHNGWANNAIGRFLVASRDWELAHTANPPTNTASGPQYAADVLPPSHMYGQACAYDPTTGKRGVSCSDPAATSDYSGGIGLAGFYVFDNTFTQEAGTPENYTTRPSATVSAGARYFAVNDVANRLSYLIYHNSPNFNIFKCDWTQAAGSRLTVLLATSGFSGVSLPMRPVFIPGSVAGNTNGIILFFSNPTAGGSATQKVYKFNIDSPGVPTDITSQFGTALTTYTLQNSAFEFRPYNSTIICLTRSQFISWPVTVATGGAADNGTVVAFDAAVDSSLAQLGLWTPVSPDTGYLNLTPVGDGTQDMFYVGDNTVNSPLLFAPAQAGGATAKVPWGLFQRMAA